MPFLQTLFWATLLAVMMVFMFHHRVSILVKLRSGRHRYLKLGMTADGYGGAL